jgi:RNA polymerase sigma factor (sigma-70 family)
MSLPAAVLPTTSAPYRIRPSQPGGAACAHPHLSLTPRYAPLPDISGLVLAAQRDPDAHLGALFIALQPELLRYFARHGLEDDADILSQDVCICVERSLAKIDPARVRSWVGRIATNLGLNELRRRRREARRLAQLVSLTGPPPATGHIEGPEEAHATSAAEARLWARCQELLPTDQVTTLRMLVLGYDTAAIAKQLGIAETTVRTRVQRARVRLREHGLAAHMS